MDLIKFFAACSLTSPIDSVLADGEVLRVSAAGRRSANELERHLRAGGVEVYHKFMQMDNYIRFKVSDAALARFIIESLD